MSSFTWASGINGDWSVGANWSGGVVPNDAAANVSITTSPTASSYTVLLPVGAAETVNALTLNAAGATLTVAGTLNFAGTNPAMTFGLGALNVNTGGVISGAGNIGANQIAGAAFVNNGTIIANTGTGTQLNLFTKVTNSGTLIAKSGNLFVAGTAGITNLVGSTLTGGTYISQGFIADGETAAASNILAFGFNFDANIAVDAANIVLDGPASLIQGYVGPLGGAGTFQTLEQQLQTIATAGTLQVIGNRGYSTTNTLTDDGRLIFQGGTLSAAGIQIGSAGRIEGYGTVTTALTNQGTIIANGGTLGALILNSVLSGGGTVDVATGSRMIVQGGTTGALIIESGGTLIETGALTVNGSATGGGKLLLGNGGSLELGGPSNVGIAFGGANGTLRLDQPLQFTGTLTGFGVGNALILNGLQGNSATIVNNNTLAIIGGGSTIDTLVLSGNYGSAAFSVTPVGADTVVQTTGGAPARNNMPIQVVSLVDNAGLAAEEANILKDLEAAAADWGQYITGYAPLRISLTLASSGSFGNELAIGSPGGYIATGETVSGHPVFRANSIQALTTGEYVSSLPTDIAITLFATGANLDNFYINPNPGTPGTVPVNKIDLVTVLAHEIGHGLGLNGFINTLSPIPAAIPVFAGAAISTYDAKVSANVVNGNTLSGALFTGTNAQAAYGALLGTFTSTPVALTLKPGDQENFYHVANTIGEVLAGDLMSGVGISTGTSIAVSALDIAMLKDIGVPVTADVVCYGRGTRIATPNGEIAVEALRVGDRVTTGDGAHVPIVWLGYRRVDCRAHPHPRRVLPVVIKQDAFGPSLPRRDLTVSPNHALWFDGVLIPARLLIDGVSVVQIDVDVVDYFHVELPHHDLLLAEGLRAESYLNCDDRQLFDNGTGALAIPPEAPGRVWAYRACAELCLVGAEIDAARAHLARMRESAPNP